MGNAARHATAPWFGRVPALHALFHASPCSFFGCSLLFIAPSFRSLHNATAVCGCCRSVHSTTSQAQTRTFAQFVSPLFRPAGFLRRSPRRLRPCSFSKQAVLIAKSQGLLFYKGAQCCTLYATSRPGFWGQKKPPVRRAVSRVTRYQAVAEENCRKT